MAEYNGSSVNIYYVDGGAGSDSNAGTGVTAAWKTLEKAWDEASGFVDGDELRILKTGNDAVNYRPAQGLTVDWSNIEVIINGAGTSTDGGFVDGTIIEINGGSLDSSTPMMLFNTATSDMTTFTHIKFQAADTSQHCVEATVANIHNVNFLNCQFTQATHHGVYTNNLANYWNMINCRFDNNGGEGLQLQHTNFSVIYKCLFDNNAGDGGRFGNYNRIIECVFTDNGDDGAYISNSGSVVCNCVFDSNVGDGVYRTGSGQGLYVNNVFSNNGAYPFNTGSNTEVRGFYDAFYGNAQSRLGYTSGTDHQSLYNYVEGATTDWGSTPDFDYTPDGASPLRGAGMPAPYKWFGSTSDDIGLNKWKTSESISVF